MVDWLFVNWLWVRIPLMSLKLKICYLFEPRSFFTFRKTIEGRLTLKLVRDMITTYSIYLLVGICSQLFVFLPNILDKNNNDLKKLLKSLLYLDRIIAKNKVILISDRNLAKPLQSSQDIDRL